LGVGWKAEVDMRRNFGFQLLLLGPLGASMVVTMYVHSCNAGLNNYMIFAA
jgi:hypothetical protein